MTPRPYRDGGDLEALQDFTATAIAQHGHLGFLHPGDIPHRIYNGLRHDDPSELVHIWEDDDGLILGWVFLHPRGGWFEPQISPEARSVHSGLECEMLEWAEARLRISMTAGGFAKEHLVTAVSENDGMRVALLAERGWELDPGDSFVLTRRAVAVVDPGELVDGYRVRTARGVEEAGPISELHAAGFGSAWTPALYARVMESPGYSPDRELLIEAPDGELAAFAVLWPDARNRTGLFEPVAVHPDHRRLGLGKVLMRSGLLEMQKWGMEHAEVLYEESNEASQRLYLGAGFRPVERILSYRKPVGDR